MFSSNLETMERDEIFCFRVRESKSGMKTVDEGWDGRRVTGERTSLADIPISGDRGDSGLVDGVRDARAGHDWPKHGRRDQPEDRRANSGADDVSLPQHRNVVSGRAVTSACRTSWEATAEIIRMVRP